jgi:hypothetical protein
MAAKLLAIALGWLCLGAVSLTHTSDDTLATYLSKRVGWAETGCCSSIGNNSRFPSRNCLTSDRSLHACAVADARIVNCGVSSCRAEGIYFRTSYVSDARPVFQRMSFNANSSNNFPAFLYRKSGAWMIGASLTRSAMYYCSHACGQPNWKEWSASASEWNWHDSLSVRRFEGDFAYDAAIGPQAADSSAHRLLGGEHDTDCSSFLSKATCEPPQPPKPQPGLRPGAAAPTAELPDGSTCYWSRCLAR